MSVDREVKKMCYFMKGSLSTSGMLSIQSTNHFCMERITFHNIKNRAQVMLKFWNNCMKSDVWNILLYYKYTSSFDVTKKKIIIKFIKLINKGFQVIVL